MPKRKNIKSDSNYNKKKSHHAAKPIVLDDGKLEIIHNNIKYTLTPISDIEFLKFKLNDGITPPNTHTFTGISNSAFYHLNMHQFLHLTNLIPEKNDSWACNNNQHKVPNEYLLINYPNLEDLGFQKFGLVKAYKARDSNNYYKMQELRKIVEQNSTEHQKEVFYLLLNHSSELGNNTSIYKILDYNTKKFEKQSIKYGGRVVKNCIEPIHSLSILDNEDITFKDIAQSGTEEGSKKDIIDVQNTEENTSTNLPDTNFTGNITNFYDIEQL